MKNLWNKRMALRALYLFLSLSAVVVLSFLLTYIPQLWSVIKGLIGIIMPFIVGFVIAYLINPCYNFFRYKVFGKLFNRKKPHPRLTKSIALLTTYLLILGIITFLLYIVIPQVITSITELIANIPSYYSSFTEWVKSLGFGISDSVINDVLSKALGWLVNYIKNFDISDLVVIKDVTVSIASGVFTFVIGAIASIYMLYNKEKLLAQSKKLGFSIFSRRSMLKLQRFVGESHITFGKYLSGVFTDAFIVGCLTFIVSMLCQIPYATLIGVIVGMTNVIPYFGPFIGGIPSVLIVLVIDPLKAVWLTIALVSIQQLDANFITPRVVGQKTGMPALWVMFSIIFCGGVFGVVGMIIAVPMCSVLFSMIRGMVNRKLERKRLPAESADYEGVSIDEMVKIRVRPNKKEESASDSETDNTEENTAE